MPARLLERYRQEITASMMQKFNLKNKLQAPRLEKIVVNMGVGPAAQDIKILETACNELALITGQHPIITRARKAISNFKIKRGSAIGCMVTLRGNKMYEFFDRLVNVALPRIKDFRGFSPKAFDVYGNYTFGINEQTIFPEIDIDKVTRLQGMNITLVIKAEDSNLARAFLQAFGFPFRK